MTLSVFSNHVIERVVAESEEDAARVWEENMGEPYDSEYSGDWELEADDKQLTITDEDHPEQKETKTCREWADENGRGYLCSTEW